MSSPNFESNFGNELDKAHSQATTTVVTPDIRKRSFDKADFGSMNIEEGTIQFQIELSEPKYDDKAKLNSGLIAQSRARGRTYHGFFLAKLILITSFGGFLFGYDTGVIAGANLYLHDDFHGITAGQKETVVSVALLGAAIGSLVAGPLSDKYGRKWVTIAADLLFTVGAIVMGNASSILMLVFGRLIVGLGVGTAAMVVPIYLSEISPPEIRGSMVTMNILLVTSGQCISILICLALGRQWRWMLGLAGVPSFLQLVGISFMPESPRWLATKGRTEEAEHIMKQIYRREYVDIRLKELFEEVQSFSQESHESQFSQICQLITKYRNSVIIGMGLQFWQQMCGINTAMYYGPEVLRVAGFHREGSNDEQYALFMSLPLAAMNAFGTAIAVCINDRIGRRYLMLRTLPGIGISMVLIGVGMAYRNFTDQQELGKWMALISLISFLAFFSIGMGGTPWIVNSEIYPIHLRGSGNALATTSNWISNYIVCQVFLTAIQGEISQTISFCLIGAFSWFAWLFIYFMVPETKDKPIGEVLAIINKDVEFKRRTLD